MRSLKSCWIHLSSASANQLIVAMAAGAFEIWPADDARAEMYLTHTPERVVGVYSPGADYADLVADADAQADRTNILLARSIEKLGSSDLDFTSR